MAVITTRVRSGLGICQIEIPMISPTDSDSDSNVALPPPQSPQFAPSSHSFAYEQNVAGMQSHIFIHSLPPRSSISLNYPSTLPLPNAITQAVLP
ncbi:hypothetical protein BDN70DRAFT_375884 [Pholiota conissans]|uniref:Uncharacterized protein n=1 Tax=Pholiota conissans TaxID=109636 RepID=A0A9P5YR51_9AGAR|nr:hypothetical protein BDN70DRAFT_375884 [Pholiota conissans]